MFNNEDQIIRALESVILQSHAPEEILVIDDGSADDSIGVVLEHFGSSVKLQFQDNAGPGAARNLGLINAKNEWVAFLDADDVWAERHLESLAMTIDKFPTCALVAARHFPVHENDHIAWPAQIEGKPTIHKIDFFSTPGFSPFQTSAVAVRRRELTELGGFADSRLGEDVDCWARLALRYPIAMIERETVAHLQRPLSLMGQMNGRVASTYAEQPIFLTLETALLRTKSESKREAISSYRVRLFNILLKQSLFDADAPSARQFIAKLRNLNHSPPRNLIVLSYLGPSMLRMLRLVRSFFKGTRQNND